MGGCAVAGCCVAVGRGDGYIYCTFFDNILYFSTCVENGEVGWDGATKAQATAAWRLTFWAGGQGARLGVGLQLRALGCMV